VNIRICIFLRLAGIPSHAPWVRALHQQLHHDTIAFTQDLLDAEMEIWETGDPAPNMLLNRLWAARRTASAGTPDRS
jgi:hypothetical protein